MKDALKIEVDDEMILRDRTSYEGYVHRCTVHAFEAPTQVPSRPQNSKGQVLFVDFYSCSPSFLVWTSDDEIALLTW